MESIAQSQVKFFPPITSPVSLPRDFSPVLSCQFKYQYFLKFRTADNGFVFSLAKKRGNRAYDYFLNGRFFQIAGALSQVFKIGNGLTNTLFLTLTFDGKVSDSWEKVPEAVTKFLRRLRRQVAIRHYVVALEATTEGRCHAHVILVLDRQVKYKVRKSGKRKRGYINDSVRDDVKALWTLGHLDAQAVYSVGWMVRYLKKEMVKSLSGAEDSWSNYENGDMEAVDRKKLLSLYHATKRKLRLFRCDRRLDLVVKNNSTSLDNTVTYDVTFDSIVSKSGVRFLFGKLCSDSMEFKVSQDGCITEVDGRKFVYSQVSGFQ